jgi:exosortase
VQPAAAVPRAPARPTLRSPAERQAILAWGVLFVAALAIYAPILRYMVRHWGQSDDYSHGFLIAPLALYFAWERRRKLRRTPIQPSWWGLLPLALGSLTLVVGRLGVELMNMRVSFVLTLIGLVLLLFGVRIFKVLAFPLLFLFLMVPLPQSLVNVVAFPLQLIAADFAAEVLYLLRIPALREGNIIHLANTQLFVEEACSGLRSLMALITLGVIFAYFFRKSAAERIVIVLSAIPIAILVNAFRVALTGVLTHHIGEKAAGGWIHQTEGLFTFAIAFLLLMVEAQLLERFWPSRWRSRPARKPA